MRWFRREIAAGVAQRLAAEAVVVSALTLGALLAAGSDALVALMASAIAFPAFVVLRVALACASNPMTSAALMRWPHPTGSIRPAEQTNIGSSVDTALKSFRFSPRGAFDEWGGSTTNIYTRDTNQVIVGSSEEDDLLVISALHDDRLVVTTTQLVPPHEKLIVNRQASNDVRTVLSAHVDLIKHLNGDGPPQLVPVSLDDVMRFLAIEWDAWDQIGPLLGPFVAIGQKRQPTLMQVHVSSTEILERTGAPEPRITVRPSGNAGVLTQAPSANRPEIAASRPSLPIAQTSLAAPIPTEVIPAVPVAAPAAAVEPTPPAAAAVPPTMINSLPRPVPTAEPERPTTEIFSSHPLDEVA